MTLPSPVLRRVSQALRRRAGRFAENAEGVSLVEFAFMFPVLVMILFLVISLSHMMMIDRKVTLTSQAAADLIAQRQGVDLVSLRDVERAAELMMQPFAADFDISVVHVPFDDSTGNPDMSSTAVWRATMKTDETISDGFAVAYATGNEIVGPNEANNTTPPNADDSVGPMGLAGDALIILRMNYYYQSLWLNDISFFGVSIPGTMTFSKVNFARPRLIRQIESPSALIAVSPPPSS